MRLMTNKARYHYRCAALVALLLLLFAEIALYNFTLEPHRCTQSPGGQEQFTIVLNTFKAEDLLRASVAQYSRCAVVARIHVVWAESAHPPDLSASLCCRKTVTFSLPSVTHNDSSLNVRFLPVPDIQTEAVLSIDDDILLSCTSLEQAFRQWQQRPNNLVGWFPRQVLRPKGGGFHYRTKAQTLLFDGAYSIVLTKAAFLRHEYLEMYSSQMPPSMLAMVREWRNCEDIAMQFLVSNRTGSSPWFVWEPRIVDKGAGLWNTARISSGVSHVERRGQCIDELTKVFGALPSTSLHSHGWFRSWLLSLSPLLDVVSFGSWRVSQPRLKQGVC